MVFDCIVYRVCYIIQLRDQIIPHSSDRFDEIDLCSNSVNIGLNNLSTAIKIVTVVLA